VAQLGSTVIGRRLLLLALSLVPLALGACAGILGVDFDGRPRGDAGDGGVGSDVLDARGSTVDDTGSSDPIDASGTQDPAGLDRAWSRWPISQSFPSNQTTKQDGLIFDSVTGLVWPDTALDPIAFAGTASACAALRLGGFDDWRVPTRIELLTLVNYLFIPAVSADLLDNSIDSWTASPFADDPSRSWYVSFMSGAAKSRPKTDLIPLRCVRAGVVPKNPKNAPPRSIHHERRRRHRYADCADLAARPRCCEDVRRSHGLLFFALAERPRRLPTA
jgi:hypothetical protein